MEGGTTTVRSVPIRFRMITRQSTIEAISPPTVRLSLSLRWRSAFKSLESLIMSMALSSTDHAAQVGGRRHAQRRQRIGWQVPVNPVQGERGMLVCLDPGKPARDVQ